MESFKKKTNNYVHFFAGLVVPIVQTNAHQRQGVNPHRLKRREFVLLNPCKPIWAVLCVRGRDSEHPQEGPARLARSARRSLGMFPEPEGVPAGGLREEGRSARRGAESSRVSGAPATAGTSLVCHCGAPQPVEPVPILKDICCP